MKAAIFVEPGHIVLDEEPIPDVGPLDALLRIPRWEREHVLEAVQERLDRSPKAMRQSRETVEHPFGTIKARMAATHFLYKTLPKVAGEIALHVLAYNMTLVMNIMGIGPLLTAIRA